MLLKKLLLCHILMSWNKHKTKSRLNNGAEHSTKVKNTVDGENTDGEKNQGTKENRASKGRIRCEHLYKPTAKAP